MTEGRAFGLGLAPQQQAVISSMPTPPFRPSPQPRPGGNVLRFGWRVPPGVDLVAECDRAPSWPGIEQVNPLAIGHVIPYAPQHLPEGCAEGAELGSRTKPHHIRHLYRQVDLQYPRHD